MGVRFPSPAPSGALALDGDGAIHLGNYVPAAYGVLAAEEAVDDGGGAGQPVPVRSSLARVVEDDVAAGRDVLVPERPVQARGLPGVVTVDEDEVDRRRPGAGHGLAERDVPDDPRAAAGPRPGDDAPAGPFGAGHPRPQRGRVVAEGIDEVQFRAGVEDPAQRGRRRALVDA